MWATAVTKQVGKKSKSSIPLEKHIANMRQYFVEQRKEIPQLLKRVEEMEQQMATMTERSVPDCA